MDKGMMLLICLSAFAILGVSVSLLFYWFACYVYDQDDDEDDKQDL